jgi:hypothetical protein
MKEIKELKLTQQEMKKQVDIYRISNEKLQQKLEVSENQEFFYKTAYEQQESKLEDLEKANKIYED